MRFNVRSFQLIVLKRTRGLGSESAFSYIMYNRPYSGIRASLINYDSVLVSAMVSAQGSAAVTVLKLDFLNHSCSEHL